MDRPVVSRKSLNRLWIHFGLVVVVGLLGLASCGREAAPAAVDASVENLDNREVAAAGAETDSLENRVDNGVGGAASVAADKRVEGAALVADDKAVEVPVKVELTHDVICPWCRIGHHRLSAAIARYGRPVEVVYQPFLLDPDVPPEGVDLRARLAEKYGAASLDSMFDRVTQIGRADGLTFDFVKVTRTPNTIAAHMLVEAAPQAKQTAFLDRLHTAYFERGEDIGDRAVLLTHWEAAGLVRVDGEKALDDAALRQRVTTEARSQSRSGVRGVPFFRIGATTVSGAQPVEALVQALQAAGR